MMLNIKEARTLVETTVPFVRQTGLKAPVLERGRVVTTIPIEGNTNHIGIMYAGALFAVGEVTGGAMCLTTFDISRYYPVVKEVNIRFRRPATTDVSIEVHMNDNEIARIDQEAAQKGKADYVLEGNIIDAKGETVAVIKGIYQLRAIGT